MELTLYILRTLITFFLKFELLAFGKRKIYRIRSIIHNFTLKCFKPIVSQNRAKCMKIWYTNRKFTLRCNIKCRDEALPYITTSLTRFATAIVYPAEHLCFCVFLFTSLHWFILCNDRSVVFYVTSVSYLQRFNSFYVCF